MSSLPPLPKLARVAHAGHCNRCLSALPSSHAHIDASRLAIGFYCLGTLDLLGLIDEKTKEEERQSWREWLWQQQTRGVYGTGFKPSSYMTAESPNDTMQDEYSKFDTPHLIMTYTAILTLAILRDDFTQLDRKGIIRFLGSCQREDGSFTSFPEGGEADLRQVYCAFAISSMLGDWSGIKVDRAVAYIQRCFSHEGGYGQQPTGEALGGTTYCALASLYLAPSATVTENANSYITSSERHRLIRWLVQNQAPAGGFSGRTNKLADACYCFWCGASLQILGVGDTVDKASLASFLARCQFKFGGISKDPDDRPDPYHTYLSLAALCLFPLEDADVSWRLPRLDPLWNASEPTANWIREHVSVSPCD
ncbi:hypothetical protein QCA50_006550 [Cerrena zonata]|uniref:Prenyltransferase alpha-alpha toroid domain-containing protein n=1 Tax=Cerrena zonata TaxID=2478898 RepID=A0AAW0GK50_9APHY